MPFKWSIEIFPNKWNWNSHFFGQFAMQNDCIKFNLSFRYDAWFNSISYTCIFFIFFSLSQHIYSIEIKDHSYGQVSSSVYSLCIACRMLHCAWTENWFELVQFNWLTIIYASCKHNGAEAMEFSCSQSVIGSICRVVNFPRIDVIYKWYSTINTSQRACTLYIEQI